MRLEMREEIRRIHAQTKITTIYVTHDQKDKAMGKLLLIELYIHFLNYLIISGNYSI